MLDFEDMEEAVASTPNEEAVLSTPNEVVTSTPNEEARQDSDSRN